MFGVMSAGGNGYHLKDRSLSALRLAVERLLAGERRNYGIVLGILGWQTSCRLFDSNFGKFITLLQL